ncbi:hypothetical protein VTG60DRAFT_5256 [Thermothelomyces hinnuleus]
MMVLCKHVLDLTERKEEACDFQQKLITKLRKDAFFVWLFLAGPVLLYVPGQTPLPRPRVPAPAMISRNLSGKTLPRRESETTAPPSIASRYPTSALFYLSFWSGDDQLVPSSGGHLSKPTST